MWNITCSTPNSLVCGSNRLTTFSLAGTVSPANTRRLVGSTGGATAGFVMAYDNGVTVYDAGDTCLFSDMQLISQMYGPQVAILPWAASTPLGCARAPAPPA